MKKYSLASLRLVLGFAFACAMLGQCVSVIAKEPTAVELAFDHPAGQTLQLQGQDARLQLLVSTLDAKDQRTDQTSQVKYEVKPAGRIAVSDSGLVTPLADGTARVVAKLGELSAEVEVEVSGTESSLPVSFPGQVTPILTKLSCNSGGCHGKAAGQNGFKLSLLGFDPTADYERLTRETRGRRLSRAAPDRSLFLLKAINESPHGGGQRLEKDSHEYRVLRRWIQQGMPYGSDERVVTKIEVFPGQRRLHAGTKQQLRVLASFSDGAVEDITRAAVYESNDTEMAEVTETGKVAIGQLTGDVAVMARYQGQVAVFRADVPQRNAESIQIADWPQPANVIDKHVYAKLASLGIPPAEQENDLGFLRRVTLDLAGRLPTLDELRRFEENTSPQKRAELVDRLLASDDYAKLFARKWSLILRNSRTSGELEFRNIVFHQWLEDSIRENKPYDQLVTDLVTASGSVSSNPAVSWLNHVTKSEERAEDIAQLFLGQRIGCARCHHHPYEKWSQADYAKLTAFFSLVSRKGAEDPREAKFVSRAGVPAARHPTNGQTLKASPLEAATPDFAQNRDPRQVLAQWMTDPSNPYFARSVANRYWKHFMGRGLVEPEDDMRVTNPPSNPELLDAMAEVLVDTRYDLKELIRLICNSNTYQASSAASEANLGDRRSYSRFYPKRLTAETLLDAVDQVTQTQTKFANMPLGTRARDLPDTGFNSYFLSVFGEPEGSTACECERSQEANLAQSLYLLNSKEVQSKLSADSGRSALLVADQRPVAEKIAELYLLSLSRTPTQAELDAAVEYVELREDKKLAYEDLVWSLMNSKEFMFNH